MRALVGFRGFVSWVFDDCDDTGGHEAGGPGRRAGAGHLGDLDLPAAGGYLDATTSPRRTDLVNAHAGAGVDDDLDAIAFHDVHDPPAIPIALRPARTTLVWDGPRRA